MAGSVISWKTTRWCIFGSISADFQQVPGDRLALAVGVGCQVDLLGVLGQRFELFDHRALFVRDAVLGRKIVLHIHRELRAQQIAHVADRGLDGVTFAQETPDSARFGRQFDNHQFPAACAFPFFGRG